MPLKRALGLSTLTLYGVGIILGAGIYSVLGVAAAHAGEALWISFTIAGLVALLTALSYAELATAHPRTSAEFTYLREALPRWPQVALVTGLLVALSGAATCSTVSIAFAGYLRTFFDLHPALVAWTLIAAATALNLAGVEEVGWVNAAFTVLEAGGLVLFIVVGATAGDVLAPLAAEPGPGVMAAVALVFFSFLGFEHIANLAEESRRPHRDVPLAILLSGGIATALYVLVALAAVTLLAPEQLGASGAPLADAARTRSDRVAGAMGGIALFATANTGLVAMLIASRVLFGIARAGELPRGLAALSRRKAPWATILVVTAVAAALVPFGRVEVVASMSSFASLLAFAAVNVALIVLRFRDPGLRRPFRVPLAVGRFPLLPAFGALATLAVATQLERTALVGGGVVLVALGAFAWWRHRSP